MRISDPEPEAPGWLLTTAALGVFLLYMAYGVSIAWMRGLL